MGSVRLGDPFAFPSQFLNPPLDCIPEALQSGWGWSGAHRSVLVVTVNTSPYSDPLKPSEKDVNKRWCA